SSQTPGPSPKQQQESSAPTALAGKSGHTEIFLPPGDQPADTENTQLETRLFQVDLNAFLKNQGVGAFPLGNLVQNGAGIGGGSGFGVGGNSDGAGVDVSGLNSWTGFGVGPAQPLQLDADKPIAGDDLSKWGLDIAESSG